jgi:hypothetical protein
LASWASLRRKMSANDVLEIFRHSTERRARIGGR